MDRFCIDRTTLFDKPQFKTLENPEQHSVHCLIEVNSCINSPFEVLIDPGENSKCTSDDGTTLYSRGFTLDDNGRSKVVSLAKEIGICNTDCVGDKIEFGFRATVYGEVVEGTGSSNTPPTLAVSRIEESTSAGCGNETMTGMDTCITASGGLMNVIYAHAGLMFTSWGMLLPLGVVIAKFGKHRPNDQWYQLHRAIQVVGLILATIGWIIALRNFNVFGDVGMKNYYHGIFGSVTMTLGLLQPINAFLRPHTPEEGEEKSVARNAWEILHKTSGYLAVVFAIITIILGTFLLPVVSDRAIFRALYGVVLAGILGVAVYLFTDAKGMPVNQNEPKADAMDEPKDDAKNEETA